MGRYESQRHFILLRVCAVASPTHNTSFVNATNYKKQEPSANSNNDDYLHCQKCLCCSRI